MPTVKKRLNITLSPAVEKALSQIAKRDKIPAATRVAQLLEVALEIEEDEVWASIATRRMKQKNSTVGHTVAWK